MAASQEPNLIDSDAVKSAKYFPNEFLFGASTAAFQIEGAWNLDGKGPNIWDDFTHDHPEKIVDHQTADVGPNSYEFFEEDIKAVQSLGVEKTYFDFTFHSKTFCFSDELLSIFDCMGSHTTNW